MPGPDAVEAWAPGELVAQILQHELEVEGQAVVFGPPGNPPANALHRDPTHEHAFRLGFVRDAIGNHALVEEAK